jgi:dsRNA-specific ribonuclease
LYRISLSSTISNIGSCRRLISLTVLEAFPDIAQPTSCAKNQLQEEMQRMFPIDVELGRRPTPVYTQQRESDGNWRATVSVGAQLVSATAVHRSSKRAQELAAKHALRLLKEIDGQS